MLPTSVTVGLVLSFLTISRILFGSVTSDHVGFTLRTRIEASAVSAHAGSCTGLVGADVNDSPPPNPFSDVSSFDGFGTRVAVMELSSFRNCIATRFTSATVTLRIASTVSSGDLRPSAARACDQTEARSDMELRRNSAEGNTSEFQSPNDIA